MAERRAWLTAGSTLAGFAAGIVAASLVAAVAFGAFFYWRGGPRFDLGRPTVVQRIQQLQRLETVMFSMDKIVSGGYESKVLPRFLSGDRLLLMVYGDVTAGVDLRHLTPDSVYVSGSSVRLTVPPAEIFATRLDNQKTRVFSRETGLFTPVDPNLESELRREAERQVQQSALDGGILTTAAANARTTIDAFLRGLGFTDVQIQ